MDFDRLYQLVKRIQSYPRYEVVLELVLLWLVLYIVLRVLRGTRGARVIKAVALILIVSTLVIRLIGSQTAFERLGFLYENFVLFASLALVVVFAPELRRALVRLGDVRIFTGRWFKKTRVLDEIMTSIAYLSKNKIGALVAFERQVNLDGIVEAGTRLDAVVSAELLNTIFWPGSALHDMGVIIRGDRVLMAGAQFPLAEGESFSFEIGSRHRAAIGLSQEADALIVVVSEETGTISLADRGQLVRSLTLSDLRDLLVTGLGGSAKPAAAVDPSAGKAA